MASNRLVVEIVGDSKNLSRTLSKSSNDLKGFSRTATSSLRAVAGAAIGLGVAFAAASGVKKIIGSASDLNEQLNKSTVVFGESAAAITSWSKTTASALGLSQAKALEAAGSFGQILETSGLVASDAARMSKQIVELGADLASFNNIDPAEALDKLRSGLAGQAEPLRTVGVLLSENRVKQEAYASGIAKAGAELTEGQKVQARFNLILKDTATAQGDFARTSDGLANASRIARAQIENISAQLGGVFLPVVAKALTGVNKFVEGFSKAQGVKGKFDFTVGVIKDVGGQVLDQIREQFNRIDFGALAHDVGQKIGAALSAIGDFLGTVNWSAVGRKIGDGIVQAAEFASKLLNSVDWSAVGNSIVGGIRRFIEGVNWKALALTLVKLFVAAIKANLQLLKGVGGALGRALLDGIKAGLRELGRQVEILALNVVLKIVKAFDVTIPGIGVSIVPGIGKIVAGIEAKLEHLAATAKTAGDAVGDAVTKAIGSSNRSAAVPTETTTTPTVVPDPVVTPVVDTKPIETAAEKAKRLFDHLLDGLQLGLEKAQATKPFGDDLKAIAAIIAALRKRAAVAKDDLDIQHQLVTALGQQRDILKEQAAAARDLRTQRQFKALGLNAQGGDIIPGADNLRKQLASLTDRLSASPVKLSSKLQSQLAGVRKILSGSLGKTTAEVRAKIAELFATIRGEFDKGAKGPLTKTTSLNANKVLEGLGLSPADAKTLTARLSQFNSAGQSLGSRPGTSGSFGVSAGRPLSLTTTTNLIVDGQKLATNTTKHQEKNALRNPLQKRG